VAERVMQRLEQRYGLRACLRSLDAMCRSHQGRYMQLLQRNANSGE
jgi:hypothetical protein